MSDPTRWAAFRLWADEEGGDCPKCGIDSALNDESRCRTCGLCALTGAE